MSPCSSSGRRGERGKSLLNGLSSLSSFAAGSSVRAWGWSGTIEDSRGSGERWWKGTGRFFFSQVREDAELRERRRGWAGIGEEGKLRAPREVDGGRGCRRWYVRGTNPGNSCGPVHFDCFGLLGLLACAAAPTTDAPAPSASASSELTCESVCPLASSCLSIFCQLPLASFSSS